MMLVPLMYLTPVMFSLGAIWVLREPDAKLAPGAA